MSYQSNTHFESGLGLPGSGFASRRGGSQVFNKRLSMAPPSNISTINETQQANAVSTPRTSRSHLLAGLRTAPKSPMYPGSAPPTQAQHSYGLQPNRYNNNEGSNLAVPQTAIDPTLVNAQHGGMNGGNHMYGLPEILAPPQLEYGQEQDNTIGMDPEEYATLMAHGQRLAQQQLLLQQQLANLTMAQQRMQNLGLGSSMNPQQQYLQSTIPPANGFYDQQLQNGLQPVVEQVPGTPGLYSVFNPMTGQKSFMINESEQIQATASAPVANHDLAHSPPPTTPTFHAQVSPPPESNAPVRTFRSPSPPKSISPPAEVNPLPPPSSTAFRRGHKQLSSVTGFTSKAGDGLKSVVPKTASFPLTPMTGTFGPGQSRAGDHPMRQPRGPPSLEELVSKPTSKHEGSKNFVTRQRRRALNSLVRAGVERRGASRGSNSIDSPGSGTPSSEIEITFSVSSDTDTDSVGSNSSGSIHGAIGEERKKLKEHSYERKPTGSFTTTSLSSEDGIGGKMVEIKVDEVNDEKNVGQAPPMLVLTSATEKRRSAIA